MDDLKKLMENTVIAELARQAGHDPEESIFEQGTDLYHGITYYYEGPIDPEAIGVAAVNALPAFDALVDAAQAQLDYMDLCNDKGDLERNLRRALAAVRAALNQEPTHE